jgi:hypothetical protein
MTREKAFMRMSLVTSHTFLDLRMGQSSLVIELGQMT